MISKNVRMFLAVLVALVWMLPANAADTIKLAVVEPLSGNFKDIGERYLEGVEDPGKENQRTGRTTG